MDLENNTFDVTEQLPFKVPPKTKDGFQNMELRNTISSTSIRKMVLQKDIVHIAKNMFQSAHPNITRKDSAMCVDNQLLFVLWESLEDFVQSGTESILSRGDARLLVLCSGSFMPERGIKRAAIQIAKLPAMKSKEESSLQMERKFPISFMICSNNGKCVGFRVEVLGIILAVTVNIKEWFIHIPCRICPGMN